ncbi:hypothetical protein ACFW5I_34305 [Streptomyces sp. NPDC058818]|uniref:hypothetical protein n=1 Tax=Streptomyces sp. NPDC058818 TaxID=3346640 RepID=UPI0036A4B664
MGPVHADEDQSLTNRPMLSAVALEGGERIGEARNAARRFMTEVQAVHGIAVSERAMGLAEQLVSELVTKHKYAPSPCLLDLEINDGAVEVRVCDNILSFRCRRKPIRTGSASTAWRS